jgi:hypothetical protein
MNHYKVRSSMAIHRLDIIMKTEHLVLSGKGFSIFVAKKSLKLIDLFKIGNISFLVFNCLGRIQS